MSDSELVFASRRSPVHALGGMVASSQPLATQAGLSILMKGGNAADAAVATAAALNVTEPGSTGLGGDCFSLYYEARTRRVSALNGSGRAPRGLSIDLLRSEGLGDSLPLRHPHTVTVPGACAGWCDLIQRHGSMDMAEILSPAIHLAEEGFPVAPISSQTWRSAEELLLKISPGGIELTVAGNAPHPGQIMRNPTLAEVMKSIASNGKKDFYKGWIAERIVSTLRSLGSVMTREDLEAHESTWEEPISVVYKGIRLFECPPNGQGLTTLIALNILSQFDFSTLGEPLSAGRLHHLIEALRLAFADTRWYVADPFYAAVPVDELLSGAYASIRAGLISPNRAGEFERGTPTSSSDTVYLSVVDGFGNACSFINSNYYGFGSGIVPTGTGFALQNRGHNFSLDPEHPNCLQPGKRPYHTIIPAMATRESDGSLYACFGVMGGFMQPQGHLQVFLGLTEDGLNPQEVLDRPRFCIEGGVADGVVAIEDGISHETYDLLAGMGHKLRWVKGDARGLFGRGQVILRDPSTGVLCAGSDPRADGCAMGF